MKKQKSHVDISGLDKAEVFRGLYLNAGSVGLGAVEVLCRIHKTGEFDLSIEAAREIVSNQLVFDYFRGMRMKVDLSGDRFYQYEYNQYSQVSASEIVEQIRKNMEERDHAA